MECWLIGAVTLSFPLAQWGWLGGAGWEEPDMMRLGRSTCCSCPEPLLRALSVLRGAEEDDVELARLQRMLCIPTAERNDLHAELCGAIFKDVANKVGRSSPPSSCFGTELCLSPLAACLLGSEAAPARPCLLGLCRAAKAEAGESAGRQGGAGWLAGWLALCASLAHLPLGALPAPPRPAGAVSGRGLVWV